MAGLSEQQKSYIHQNTVLMLEALAQPCTDCNIVWHPLVMTFDHVGRVGKKFSISTVRAIHPQAFMRELDKCEVVCRNCHQIREYLRDLGVVDIGNAKKDRYKYYERLIPYLCGGAMLRRDAFQLVKI